MNQYEVTSNYDVYNTMISVIGDATFHLQHPSITESVYKPISFNYFSDSLTALIRFIIFSYKSPAPASPCSPSCYCVPAAGTNICGSGSETSHTPTVGENTLSTNVAIAIPLCAAA